MSKSQKWWKNFDRSRQFKFEDLLIHQGCEVIGGIDEVGVGAIFGPVASGFAIVDLDRMKSYSFQFNKKVLFPYDSKALERNEREALLIDMRSKGLILKESVGWVKIEEINQLQDMNKIRDLAWNRALEYVNWEVEGLLTDFYKMPSAEAKGIKVINAIKMDQKSINVATASIVAKVARDHAIIKLGQKYPGYQVERNMGYLTPEHAAMLKRQGTTPEHRIWYNNIQELIKKYGDTWK